MAYQDDAVAAGGRAGGYTSLSNPDNALTLYTLIVVVGFLFSDRWKAVRDVLTGQGKSGQ